MGKENLINCKVVLIGEPQCGKTTLFNRWINNQNQIILINKETIAIDVASVIATFNSENFLHQGVKFLLFDTPSKKTSQALVGEYCRKMADVIMLCIDLSIAQSSDFIASQVAAIRRVVGEEKPIVLVGTKADLERKVSEETLQAIATANNLFFQPVTCIVQAKNNVCIFLPNVIINLPAFKALLEGPELKIDSVFDDEIPVVYTFYECHKKAFLSVFIGAPIVAIFVAALFLAFPPVAVAVLGLGALYGTAVGVGVLAAAIFSGFVAMTEAIVTKYFNRKNISSDRYISLQPVEPSGVPIYGLRYRNSEPLERLSGFWEKTFEGVENGESSEDEQSSDEEVFEQDFHTNAVSPTKRCSIL